MRKNSFLIPEIFMPATQETFFLSAKLALPVHLEV